MAVTFVKRQAPAAGEITVRITEDAGVILGEVMVPDGVSLEGTAAAEEHEEGIGVHQALASAIEIAEERGSRVGIIDDEGHWKPEWGDLHRV